MSESMKAAHDNLQDGTQVPAAPVVLFDGQCPLCSREIAHYRRRRGADRIDWIDITRAENDPAALGVSRTEAMARFHVRDADGRWHTGAAGFAQLWSWLPAYRWLARLVTGLRLLPLMEKGYTLFLRWRTPRQCDSDRCGKAP